jgi:hypothetical protein
MRALTAGLLIASVLAATRAQALDSSFSGLYQVTTETAMPHLEENLRYATTRKELCLRHQDLSAAFPILRHEALRGCKLDHESRSGETVSYVLSCEGEHGTTGAARWEFDANEIHGTLEVKLGGKNMTFYQRITAKPLGECVR